MKTSALLESARERLDELLVDWGDRPAPRATSRAFLSDHDPWYVELESAGEFGCAGQRAFLRSSAPLRVIVAGRQSGKTHQAAEEVVRIILARPHSESCLLMPTYKSTKGALRHLRRALRPLGDQVTWKEQDKCFSFPNGATLYVRTADDKSGVPTRGLTLDGVLWVDEASFVPQAAWDAAQLTQAAVKDPVTICTTTPLGRKSWVFDLCAAAAEDENVEWFRFRTTDSPHHNPAFVRGLRKRVGNKRAQEELDAVFLGETDIPFPPDLVARVFASRGMPIRGKQFTLGLDLGKKRDFCVFTLTNEFGEVWILDRFRENREEPDDRFWPRVERRAIELAEAHGAIVAIDASGGAGSTMADYLSRSLGADRVFRVKASGWKQKAEIMEHLISEVEHGRLQIDAGGPHADEARHEFTFYPAPERVVLAGVPLLRYVGPPDQDADAEDALHDDCVMSVAYARYGAAHAWSKAPPPRSKLKKLLPKGARASAPRRSRYRF